MEAVRNNKVTMILVSVILLVALIVAIPSFSFATVQLQTFYQFPYFNVASIRNGSTTLFSTFSTSPLSFFECRNTINFTASKISVLFSQNPNNLSASYAFSQLTGGSYISGVFGFFTRAVNPVITVSCPDEQVYAIDSYSVSESSSYSAGSSSDWKFYVCEFSVLLHDVNITAVQLDFNIGVVGEISVYQSYFRVQNGRYYDYSYIDNTSLHIQLSNIDEKLAQFFSRITTPLSLFFGQFSGVVSRLDTLIDLVGGGGGAVDPEPEPPTPEEEDISDTTQIISGDVNNIIDSTGGLEQDLQDSYVLTDVYVTPQTWSVDGGFSLIKQSFGDFFSTFKFTKFGYFVSLPLTLGAVALILGRAGLFQNMVGNTPIDGRTFYTKSRDD